MDLQTVSAIITVCLLVACSVPNTEGISVRKCRIDNKWEKLKDTDMCCHGKVARKEKNLECCYDAREFYFPDDTVCCGDRTYNRSVNGVDYGCCGKTLIRLDSQICCNREIRTLPQEDHEHMMCCGKELVNLKTMMCCQNPNKPALVSQHVIHKNFVCCGHEIMDLTQEQCRYNDRTGEPFRINRNQEICDGQRIELRDKTCCLNKVYDVPHLNRQNLTQLNPSSGCCGRTWYNPITHKCCPDGEFSIPKKQQLHCCKDAENGYINSTNEQCCNGHMQTMTSKHDTCCGRDQIDSRTQGCCNNTPYNKGTQFCCEGVPSTILEKGKTCCGGRELMKNSLCCDNSQQVIQTRSTDDKCCLNHDQEVYVPYTSSNMDCYNGRIETRHPNDDMCYGERYHKNKAVCCRHTVEAFPKGDSLSCCKGPDLSETPYSDKHQICCDGNVYNMSINEAECCRGVAYLKMAAENPCMEKCGETYHYKDKTLCCGRQIHHKTGEDDECCGNKPYSPRTQTCCLGKLHNSTKGQCCGTDHFHHKTQRCCGGYEVIPRKSRTLRCCNNVLAYNRRVGECKFNGLVKPKRQQSPAENICKKKTWSDLSGIEVEVCGRKLAFQCTLLKKRFSKKAKEFQFTMNCQNLKRPDVGAYHETYDVQGRNHKMKVKVPSEKLKCRVKKNQKVIIFLDKTPTPKKRHHEVTVLEGDALRVVKDTRTVRQMISQISNRNFCQRIFDRMTEDEQHEYFKMTW